jgi:K+-transporting ATPase ATPase B chain
MPPGRELELAEGALFASLADDTAEGKSIVEYLRGCIRNPNRGLSC